MKFGALLRSSAQEVPDLQGLFVCYKQLKKRLKRLPVRQNLGEGSVISTTSVRENERAFVSLLITDIQTFNDTFVEREEQSVIQLSLIEDKAAVARGCQQIATVYKSFVDFHGQTLMLVHWSILAYTSVLKILKKHHKRTGLQVQEFNMQQLLSQPFCSVELISGLVRKAEAKAQELAGRLNPGMAQASLSAASPASSPVAELISVARASVKEIADTAAQGNEALDEHLRDQPTSSDEASAGGGEAEVVSGPSKLQGSRRHPGGHALGEVDGDAGEGPKAEQSSLPTLKRKDRSAIGRRPLKYRRHDPSDGAELLRTGSVAGDSELPHANHLPPSEPAAQDEVGVDGKQSVGEARGDSSGAKSASRPRSANGNSDSGSGRSPQLTMGQGYNRSGSLNILRQTQMALGLWEQLHYTASTPSTVVPPLQASKGANGSANSAA